MGSPLVSVLTNIFMGDHELSGLMNKILISLKFIQDMLMTF